MSGACVCARVLDTTCVSTLDMYVHVFVCLCVCLHTIIGMPYVHVCVSTLEYRISSIRRRPLIVAALESSPRSVAAL